MERLLACEKFVCQTGSAWGWLEGSSLTILGLWWLARHSLYLVLAGAAIFFAGSTGTWVVAVAILVLHPYKAIRYMQARSQAKKARGLAVVPAETQEDVEQGKSPGTLVLPLEVIQTNPQTRLTPPSGIMYCGSAS